MKNTCLILMTVAGLAGFATQSKAQILNSATNFAVLAGSTVTSTGDTTVTDNLGVYPGTTITGFGPGTDSGVTFAGGPVAQQAESDAATAYNMLLNEAVGQSLTGQGLGGMTLMPGVYNFSTSAGLTGALTLNANGNSNARFDFQIGSTLITGTGAAVDLIGGAQAGNVYWQVGSSATLGVDTAFAGNVLAETSITLDTGTSLAGRALALNGAVTLDDNSVTVPTDIPEPSSLWLLAVGSCLFGVRQWLVGRQGLAN